MTHLDLDGLADVLAGVGDHDHLASCTACQSRLAELESALPAVSASLASLGTPEVPAAVAERLDRALDRARPGPTADILPMHPRHTRWLPALAGVAAAGLLVTGGALLLDRGGSTPATTAAGPAMARSSSGTDYTASGLAAALPGLLGGTATAEDRAGAGATLSATAPAPQGLKGRVGAPEAVDPLARLRTTGGLASCLAALSDPSLPGLPLALDYARYAHQPALVVVLPAAAATKVDVFVVGAGCAQSDAKVLFFTRLTKP